MKLQQTLLFGIILIFSTTVLSCKNDINDREAVALNADDLEILDNCGNLLQNEESANCCIVIPSEVTTNGFYVGGAKYLVNEGETVFEPNGLKYL